DDDACNGRHPGQERHRAEQREDGESSGSECGIQLSKHIAIAKTFEWSTHPRISRPGDGAFDCRRTNSPEKNLARLRETNRYVASRCEKPESHAASSIASSAAASS